MLPKSAAKRANGCKTAPPIRSLTADRQAPSRRTRRSRAGARSWHDEDPPPAMTLTSQFSTCGHDLPAEADHGSIGVDERGAQDRPRPVILASPSSGTAFEQFRPKRGKRGQGSTRDKTSNEIETTLALSAQADPPRYGWAAERRGRSAWKMVAFERSCATQLVSTPWAYDLRSSSWSAPDSIRVRASRTERAGRTSGLSRGSHTTTL